MHISRADVTFLLIYNIATFFPVTKLIVFHH